MFCINMQAQTIDSLEHEWTYFTSDKSYGNEKNIAYKLLRIAPLNTEAISYLAEVFGRNNQADSVNFLFDSLMTVYPDSTKIYILLANESIASYGKLTYTQRINYLKKAQTIDSNDLYIPYSIGRIYYDLFIREYNKWNRK